MISICVGNFCYNFLTLRSSFDRYLSVYCLLHIVEIRCR